MKNTYKNLFVYLVIGMGCDAFGAVSLTFPVDSGFVGPTRLNIGTSVDFNFTVDGVGGVTLDASTGSANADSIATVNSWDGSVGTVSDASLFGTSFTLTASGERRDNAGTSFPAAAISADGLQGGGTLGVFGHNASIIDGSPITNKNIERIIFTVSSGTVNVALTSFDITGGAGADPTITTDSASVNYFNSGAGSVNTSSDGLSFANSEFLRFEVVEEEAEGDPTEGYRLNGITFDFTAIPEPSTTILSGLAALGLFYRRRR